MVIPDDIKENVRAVLLSKTDGSGILVSAFLKDYKAIIFEPLHYRALGYDSLEKFINDIPDVCRLEYSDVHMAYKLFGIAKPNTFVSSFVKRAEGSSEGLDTSRKSGKKLETVRPTNDLNEKWEPSARGLYTLCFPNKKGCGLDTKEAVARKFAQLGEVVEINIIPSLIFIRYREEKAAKMAVELYGDELRLRRADERVAKSSDQKKDKKKVANSPVSVKESPEKRFEKGPGLNAAVLKQNKERKENHRVLASDIDDEDWDDDGGKVSQKQSPGGGNSNIVYQKQHAISVDTEVANHCVKSPNRSIKGEEKRGSRKDAGERCDIITPDISDFYPPHQRILSMAMKRKNKKVVQKGKKVKFGPEKTEERKTSSYAAKENYVGTFRWAKLQGLKMMWPVLVKSVTPDKVLVYVKSDDDMIYISNNESNIQPYPGNLDCLKDNGIAYLKAKKMNRTLECFIQDLEWALEKYQETEAAGEVRAGINKFKGGEEIHSVFVTEHDKACVDSNARAVPECGDVEIETGIQAVTGNQTGSESEGISGKDIETKAKYTSGKEIQKVLDTEYENECVDSRSKNQETKTRDVPEFGNVEIETGIQTVTGKQTDSESEGISGKDWETKKLIGGEEIQTVLETEYKKVCVDSRSKNRETKARDVPEVEVIEMETGIQTVTGSQTYSASKCISWKDQQTKDKYESGEEIQKVLETEYENACVDSKIKNRETKARDMPECGYEEIETVIQTVTGNQTDSESEGINGKDIETKDKFKGREEIQTVLETEYENECVFYRSKNPETKARDMPECGDIEMETGIQTVTGSQTDSESESINWKDQETKDNFKGGDKIQTVLETEYENEFVDSGSKNRKAKTRDVHDFQCNSDLSDNYDYEQSDPADETYKPSSCDNTDSEASSSTSIQMHNRKTQQGRMFEELSEVENSCSDGELSDTYPSLSQNMISKEYTAKKLEVEYDSNTSDTDLDEESILRDPQNPDIYITRVQNSATTKTGKAKKHSRVYNSYQYCGTCQAKVSNLSQHLNRNTNIHHVHETNPEIKAIREEIDEHKKRTLQIQIRGKFNHEFNMKTLKKGKGEILLERRPVSQFYLKDYGPCPNCLFWYSKKLIKKHAKKCINRKLVDQSIGDLTTQSDCLTGQLNPIASKKLIKEVFSKMKPDEVSRVVKEDTLRIQLGHQWLEKNVGNTLKRGVYTSQILRLVGRFLIFLRKIKPLNGQAQSSLWDYLKPVHFDAVVEACILTASPLDDEESLKAPSNAIKLGHDIKRLLSGKIGLSIIRNDKESQDDAEKMMKLLEIYWGTKVTKAARVILEERRYYEEKNLPVPEDILALNLYLKGLISELDYTVVNKDNFRHIAEVVEAKVVIYNRRRTGEVQASRLRDYNRRCKGVDGEHLVGQCSDLEKKLLESQEVMTVRGKLGKAVPVILPSEIRQGLNYLADTNIRATVGVSATNNYLFASEGQSIVWAYDSVRKAAMAANLKNPASITSTNLRKYMATVTQVLDLKQNQMQWVLNHLSHTMDVHKIHYRATSDILERTQIAKILLLQDQGRIGHFKNKCLDEIQLEDHQAPPVQVYIGNWPHEADEGDLQALLKPYDCIGCRILQAKDSKVKKFAFVDFKEEKEALRLIKDLNNTMYRNRDLQCRLGKNKGTPAGTKENVKKGSIEQEFERLSVHKGIPELDKEMPNPGMNKQRKMGVSPKTQWVTKQGMPHLESPKMPPLESPKMPPLESPKMPPLESPEMPPLESPKMPPLESPKMPPLESPEMPFLETSNYSRKTGSQLSPCVNHVMREMPPLEKVVSPAIPSSVVENRLKGMPNLEELSPAPHINGVADQSAYIPVQLNIGNFPYGTSEMELMTLMGQFGAQRITIMNKDTTSRSTYAFADFTDVSQAVHAMDNLDQSLFKGRKLVVTLTNPGAVYQQPSVEQIPNLTCRVTEDGDRNVYIKDMPLLSPGYSSLDGENGFDQHTQDYRNFNYQRLTTTLQEYTKIGTKLRDDCGIQMVEGMTLGVRVTHVENERFFWAQIREDSINGANRGLHNLTMMNMEMQTEPKIEPISGLGRCMAKYENEWFRGWCTFITERNGQEVGDVLFIDYGNRIFAPKSEMIKSKATLWSLPPMAKPFKIRDQKCDMGRYLDQDITLEVLQPGGHRTNSLTTVRLCWM